MLLYAAMANVDYPPRPNPSSNTSSSNSSTPDNSPSSSAHEGAARSGSGVACAAAAAVTAPDLQPLSLPRQLLPSSGQAAAAVWQPLSGLRVGVYDEVSASYLSCTDTCEQRCALTVTASNSVTGT